MIALAVALVFLTSPPDGPRPTPPPPPPPPKVAVAPCSRSDDWQLERYLADELEIRAGSALRARLVDRSRVDVRWVDGSCTVDPLWRPEPDYVVLVEVTSSSIVRRVHHVHTYWDAWASARVRLVDPSNGRVLRAGTAEVKRSLRSRGVEADELRHDLARSLATDLMTRLEGALR